MTRLPPNRRPATGTTSQGLAISFHIGSDARSISNRDYTVDLTCNEVPVILRGLNAGGSTPLALTPEWSWNYSAPLNTGDPDATANVTFAGKLAVGGPATGHYGLT